jgi:hypothetical protein
VFLAGITGFIALIASAIAFVTDRTVDLYRSWEWKDEIQLISLETGLFPHFSAVLSNVGNGPVFVSYINLFWRGDNATLHVNGKISAGDFYSILDANFFLPATDYNGFVFSSTGRPSTQVIEESSLDQTTSNKNCFLTVYYIPDDSNVLRMKDFYEHGGKELVSEPARAQIISFSLHSNKKIETNVPVIVTFLRSSKDRCQKIPWE